MIIEDNGDDNDADIDIPASKSTQPADEDERPGNELAREKESDLELSRVIRLTVRPEILQNIVANGPSRDEERRSGNSKQGCQNQTKHHESPHEGPSDKGAPTIQLELRPSSQGVPEAPERFTTVKQIGDKAPDASLVPGEDQEFVQTMMS